MSGETHFPDIAVSYIDVTNVHDHVTYACMWRNRFETRVITSVSQIVNGMNYGFIYLMDPTNRSGG